MARRSLKPQLNQIRTWVRQGRTDAWIAHQLEVTVQQIDAFKRENELAPDAENGADGAAAHTELDLRAEDDAQIAAELEAEAARRAEEEAEQARRAEEEAARRAEEGPAGADETDDTADEQAKPRRRGRRGGRGRGRSSGPVSFEATFDHGEDGYGLWLDPAIADEALYAEHWSGNRDVVVTLEADQIVIRRAGDDAGSGDDD